MVYHITHVTSYHYGAQVSLSHHATHLTPRDVPYQRCRQAHIRILPQPAVLRRQNDYFGNPVTLFSMQEPHRRLVVESVSQVEILSRTLPGAGTTMPWEELRDLLPQATTPEGLDAYQYVFDSTLVKCSAELAEYALPSFPPGRPILEAARDLTSRIKRQFTFDSSATTISTPLRTVLISRRGVCQDFAQLQIGCLRSLGLAARYVSGYLRTTPPPGQARLRGADASHAWVSVYCPPHGWVDLDPTNDMVVDTGHITVAWGRDFSDISPIHGVIIGGGEHGLTLSVDVVPETEMVAAMKGNGPSTNIQTQTQSQSQEQTQGGQAPGEAAFNRMEPPSPILRNPNSGQPPGGDQVSSGANGTSISESLLAGEKSGQSGLA